MIDIKVPTHKSVGTFLLKRGKKYKYVRTSKVNNGENLGFYVDIYV